MTKDEIIGQLESLKANSLYSAKKAKADGK